jgi:hypothetical protein
MCRINGQLQCLKTATDPDNCGACGRKCPLGARCSRGQCKCPVDQCGDRCVTLSSHPKNCGSCGRVSPSGYCVLGQFYTPPAFCSRSNGFKNGNFANGASGWTADFTGGSGGTPSFDVGPDSGAEDADGMVGTFSLFAFNPKANLKTSIKMCPGLSYNLGFQIRRISGSNTCKYTISVAGEQKAQGELSAAGADWMRISGISVGPFSGERQGVIATGPELYADFLLAIRCGGASISRLAGDQTIRVDQFSMNPV